MIRRSVFSGWASVFQSSRPLEDLTPMFQTPNPILLRGDNFFPLEILSLVYVSFVILVSLRCPIANTHKNHIVCCPRGGENTVRASVYFELSREYRPPGVQGGGKAGFSTIAQRSESKPLSKRLSPEAVCIYWKILTILACWSRLRSFCNVVRPEQESVAPQRIAHSRSS